MRLFLVLLVTISAMGQSQPPAPSAGKEQRPSQQNARTKPANSENGQTPPQDSPAAINQPQTMICEQGTQQRSSEPERGSSSNGWITLFTFVIALAAVAQVVAMLRQSSYMRKQWREMERQAEIADRNAETASKNAIAMVNADRAWLDISLVVQNYCLYDLRIKNHGKTPAHSVAIRIDFRHFTNPDDAKTSTVYVASPRMWSSGEEYPIYDFDTQATVGVQDWGEIHEGRRHIVIKGEISYRNVIGDSFGISGFCYHWNGAAKEFERISSESFYK